MPQADDATATTEVDIGSDGDIFAAATAPEPEAPEQTPAAEGTGEQPRDDKGRFAAGEEKPAPDKPDVSRETPERDEGQIPSWRLREETEARRQAAKERDEAKAEAARIAAANAEMARRLARFEQPAPESPGEKPDFLLDPEAAWAHLDQKVATQLRDWRGEMSLQMARDANPDAFDKAYDAVVSAISAGDEITRLRIVNAQNPGREILSWHREQETMREVGNDPQAWFERKFEEALKDPAKAAKALEILKGQANGAGNGNGPTRPAPKVQLPPSLSTVTPSGAAILDKHSTDLSDAAIFADAASGLASHRG